MDQIDLQIPKQSATLRMAVEEKIRQAIGSGMFQPGQRLVEKKLCELIGVGRTSIREALRQLEAEGLITTYPHRGPVVSAITYEEAGSSFIKFGRYWRAFPASSLLNEARRRT